MNAYLKRVAVLALAVFMCASVLGCNTVKGAGKDVEKGGQGIQNAAEGAQK